ncbi:3-oxoacyl-[acyl-carrier-protein] reductase [Gammaproteobacteria bacterium]|jgi:3-oxoacyl-[acyl-carrier protein] reductase|nr:3-oxoacyl-[acyl-carrier-protein] reductase [Gammaproteobacteria bacterium]MDA8696656.1 3-oxoacyl-[acyl-carrier-protein] reductase [Gammaproteobacteria bacterium]MDA9039380.1 3-oxoacyl-[acyl-carrier-protein] reductase [Gammaproteobacteria bacterium]MDB4829326.1 3-oxoacyl-[acyl-carrier-protein] reductase [Gammaproteobacteria bacterium]MDC3327176.1 3-oxoacyl-[acyl-carrier-protein] reductase [Gammaproteobacteria bacterium]
MKNILITGASRGIGESIAYHFADKGFNVVGTARSEFKFKKNNFKGTLIPIRLDVTDRDSIKEAFNNLKERDLLPNILVNNAGITADQLFLRMKDEDWDNVIDINLTGTFNITKMFVKQMVKSRYGKIINISSVSGLMGNAGQVNYSSSKAALSGFTKSLAKEVGSRNITVNSIAPGFIDTDMTEYLDDKARLDLESQIPLRRIGNTKDISELVFFLASDEAAYITGQTISVDGGLFMH